MRENYKEYLSDITYEVFEKFLREEISKTYSEELNNKENYTILSFEHIKLRIINDEFTITGRLTIKDETYEIDILEFQQLLSSIPSVNLR